MLGSTIPYNQYEFHINQGCEKQPPFCQASRPPEWSLRWCSTTDPPLSPTLPRKASRASPPSPWRGAPRKRDGWVSRSSEDFGCIRWILVGGFSPPLWKIWVRPLGWLETHYEWENKIHGNQLPPTRIVWELGRWKWRACVDDWLI